MPTLIFRNGPLAGRRFQIRSEVLIGRNEADIVVEDPEISRQHAAIRPMGDGLEIRDLGSLNGTWVNGARLDQPTKLAPGDLVNLGQISVEFDFGTDADDATVASPTDRDRTVIRPPVPSTPAPDPKPDVSRSPVGPPAYPFSTTAASPRRRRPKVATRRLLGTLVTLAVVVATAAALIAYFAVR